MNMLQETTGRVVPLRFAASNGPEKVEWFRDEIAKSGRGDEIILKGRTEDAPPTRIRSGFHKLGRALAAGVLLLVSGAAGWAGWGQGQDYQEERAEVAPLMPLHDQLAPSWGAVADAAHAAERTDNLQDSMLTNTFNNRTNGFMTKLVETMRRESSGLDNELVKQLKRNQDFMPMLNAQGIASDFVQWMERTLPVPPEEATNQDIERIDIKGGFLDTPEMDRLTKGVLTDADKTALAHELKETYKEEKDYITPTFFSDAINGAINKGIQGASLQDLAALTEGDALATEEDAIEFVTGFIENNENFADLTDGQREALSERAAELLDALEIDGPSPLMAASALVLLMIAAGGGLTTLFSRGGDIVRAITEAPLDIWKGLKHPILVINYADASPESRNALDIIITGIRSDAKKIADVMRQAYESDPHVKGILDKEYGGKLPTADDALQQYIFNTHLDVMKERSFTQKLKETPMDELEFVQRLQMKLESALSTGNMIEIGLPQGMIKPDERPVVSDSASNIETLRVGRLQVEYDLREARRMLANRVTGHLIAVNELAEAQGKLTALEDRLLKLADNNASESETNTARQLMETQQKQVERKERAQERHRLLLLKGKLILSERIEQLHDFQARLTETIQKGEMAGSAKELQALDQQTQKTLADEELAELKDKMDLQQYIDQEKAERDALQAKIDAEIKTLADEKRVTGSN